MPGLALAKLGDRKGLHRRNSEIRDERLRIILQGLGGFDQSDDRAGQLALDTR